MIAGESRPAGGRAGGTALVLLVAVVATGIPLLLAFVTGSIAIPHNDAWSHTRIAQEFARSGEFVLLGWNRSALLGQIVALGPLGESIIAQHLFVAALSVVALLATHRYLHPRVGSAAALLGTAIVAMLPEFGLLATSFMTDMPAFAALMVCLVLTDRALRTGSPGWLAAALVVGVWGITIREQDLVGPVVAVAVTAVAWSGRKRAVALAYGAAAAGAILAFEVWRRALPDGDPPGFQLDPGYALSSTVRAAFTIALYLAPALFLVARPARWAASTRWASGTVLVGAVAVSVVRRGDVVLGNYLAASGAYGEAALGAREVLPTWWWAVLVAVACVSGALLAGHLLEEGLRVDRVTALAVALLIAGTIGQAALGQDTYARNLLPLVPLACVPLLARLEAPRWGRALPALALMFTTSLALTANALAFDAARWNAATALTEDGVAATDIDAGIEWVGYHATSPAVVGTGWTDGGWWMNRFSGSRACHLISASPLGSEVLGTVDYRTYAVFGHSTLWIHAGSPCE